MERESEIIGAVGFSVMSIRPGDSAVAMGIGDLPIAATSHLVNLLESAALAAIGEFLELDETTRMVAINLEILDAVAIGSEITATATCSAILGREIHFLCVPVGCSTRSTRRPPVVGRSWRSVEVRLNTTTSMAQNHCRNFFRHVGWKAEFAPNRLLSPILPKFPGQVVHRFWCVALEFNTPFCRGIQRLR